MQLNLDCMSQLLTTSKNGISQTEFNVTLNELKKIIYLEFKNARFFGDMCHCKPKGSLSCGTPPHWENAAWLVQKGFTLHLLMCSHVNMDLCSGGCSSTELRHNTNTQESFRGISLTSAPAHCNYLCPELTGPDAGSVKEMASELLSSFSTGTEIDTTLFSATNGNS